MKSKTYMRTLLALSIFAVANNPIPCGIVQISAEAAFRVEKYDFYYRAYNEPFSEELLKQCIYYEQIQHPEIVLTQARLETGHFTSELFLQANNCFGMRLAKVRETTAVGEYDYHAAYAHWTESVKDYKLFQEWYVKRGYDIENEYLAFLYYIGYATDRYYIAKLSNLSGDFS
jgi:flagellum-specific peptidoglycan hydrolase FlgJ